MTTAIRPHAKLRDVMEITGLSDPTVRRLIRSGEIRAVRVGRQWLIPADEYDRLAGR